MRQIDRILRRPALPQPKRQASLDLDFLLGKYAVNKLSKSFADIITFTRPSASTRINPLGVVESVAANIPCIDHSPVNLATGVGAQTLALAKDRIYAITAVGGTVAVAGSGVNVSQMGAASGVIQTPAGSGTVDVTFTPGGGVTALHVREVLGLGVWEQRTNYIRNSTMMGAAVGVIGAGGALPTNWGCSNGSGWTLNQQVVSTGVENGLNYIDLRFSGTPVAGQNWFALIVDSSWPTMPSSQGGAAAVSCNMKLISGVTPTASANVNELNNGTNLGNISSPFFAALDGTLKKYQAAVTSVTAGTTNFAQPRITFTPTVGVAFDFTMRIAALQIESGASASPHIPTAGSQVTRAAEQVAINNLSPWFKQTGGAVIAEFSIQSAVPPSSYPGICTFEGATGLDRIGAILTPSQMVNSLRRKSGSPDSYSGTNAVISAGAKIKFAFAWDAAGQRSCLNGAAINAVIWDGIPAGLNKFRLGIFDGWLSGYLRKTSYLKTPPTDIQLQTETA